MVLGLQNYSATWLMRFHIKVSALDTGYLVCSPSVSTMEWSLIIEVKEKRCCTSVSMVRWYGYRDYGSSWKQPLWRYWPKNLLTFTSWDIGKTLVLIEGCWSTSSNLLANYQQKTYWEISKLVYFFCYFF